MTTPTKAAAPSTLLKVLDKNGVWAEVAGELYPCQTGLHLTTTPALWYVEDCRVFETEYDGEIIPTDSADKWCARRVRLVREIVDLAMVRIFTSGEHVVRDGVAFARGSARVVAWGSARVVARGSASVEARDSASVEARDGSTVVQTVYHGREFTVALSDQAVCVDRRGPKVVVRVARETTV